MLCWGEGSNSIQLDVRQRIPKAPRPSLLFCRLSQIRGWLCLLARDSLELRCNLHAEGGFSLVILFCTCYLIRTFHIQQIIINTQGCPSYSLHCFPWKSDYLVVLVAFLLLWQNTRNKAIYKRKCLIGFMIFRGLESITAEQRWATRTAHLWAHNLLHRQQEKRAHGKWHRSFETCVSALSDTPLLTKPYLPNDSTNGHQVFKTVSLWETILIKLPHFTLCPTRILVNHQSSHSLSQC